MIRSLPVFLFGLALASTLSAAEFRHLGSFILKSHFKVTGDRVAPVPIKPIVFEVATDGVSVRITAGGDAEARTSFEIYRADGIGRQRPGVAALEVIPGLQATSNSGGVLRHLRLTRESLTITTFPGLSDQTTVTHAIATTTTAPPPPPLLPLPPPPQAPRPPPPAPTRSPPIPDEPCSHRQLRVLVLCDRGKRRANPATRGFQWQTPPRHGLRPNPRVSVPAAGQHRHCRGLLFHVYHQTGASPPPTLVVKPTSLVASPPGPPASSLVSNVDRQPGPVPAPVAADRTPGGGPRSTPYGSPEAPPFEETNLRIQHVLTAESPGGDLSRIVLNVPVLYQTRTLGWTADEVAESRELLKRLAAYQEASRALREEGTQLIAAWNRLIEHSIPTSVLRADSPSLPANQDAVDSPRKAAGLDTTESIQIQPAEK